MNDAAKFAHQFFWTISLEDYPIMRIVGRKPLVKLPGTKNVEAARGESRCPDLRVVSVGRRVPFKGYNVNVLGIVR
jgi:hypothetical protein